MQSPIEGGPCSRWAEPRKLLSGLSANKRLWIILLSSRVKEGSGPIKNLGEDLVVLPFPLTK